LSDAAYFMRIRTSSSRYAKKQLQVRLGSLCPCVKVIQVDGNPGFLRGKPTWRKWAKWKMCWSKCRTRF